VILLLFFSSIASAQGNPTDDDDFPGDPAAATINKVQDLHFGAFSVTGSGGSIAISNTGMRTASGGVTLLNLGVLIQQAIFDIEAPSGTIVSITNGPDAILNGSNGGSVTLKLGTCSPASPFTTMVEPPARTEFSIGGTLTIGDSASSPPGQYSGTFEVYINYQ
jgi:hypothetical protein